jgi:catechol 2,3-dioxygenase-like lactoylglutathione lyase family enzyme
MATVSVRYIVDDIDEAVAFYCKHLGFIEQMHAPPTFAMLTRGDLRLVLSVPSRGGAGGQGAGGRSMPDGTAQAPGGWNRFMIEVEDLDEIVHALRRARVHLRNAIVTGTGGKQVLVEDPSGNPVELFQPTLPEAQLDKA